MDNYLLSIDKQIEFNKGKNIFLEDKDSTFKFIDDTVNVILNMDELSADSEKNLIDYATDKVLEEFCRINQYYTFNRQDRNDLRSIYCNLFSVIKANKNSIESISKRHYGSIKEWLLKTNPFAYKKYSNTGIDIKPVACFEYSAEMQIKILNIDIKTLKAPILDIGCGRHGNLVKHLRDLGIDIHGIDRYSFSDSNLISSDWLEYSYGIEKWGTIVSNLGFSNHFKHHNLREDGNYIEYGKKYMDIIKSLKIGGRFHYAPDLPFIELYLDTKQNQIDQFEFGEFNFKTTVITKLK